MKQKSVVEPALVIAMEILWVRNEHKDWNEKHDPEGNAQNLLIQCKP